MVVGCQPYAPADFIPSKHPWYRSCEGVQRKTVPHGLVIVLVYGT